MNTRFYIASSMILVLVIALLGVSGASAEDEPDLPVTHQQFSFLHGVFAASSQGGFNLGNYRSPSSPICTTPTSSAANVNTDCEGLGIHNETTIAVNPTNSLNQIGSANDYQVFFSSGGYAIVTVYSRAHVTFDGGQTWSEYPIKYNNYAATGDPALAFDASGNAYLATIGFVWSQNRGCCTNPDILVAHSSDGGKNWTMPARVAKGSGTFGSPGVLNDKEFLTAWGNGNAIVTWTKFNLGIRGSYISSPIYASVTHDGGNSWSTPVEISGSAAFCAGAQGGNDCNQSTGSVPVVAADGSIYVAFLNYANDPSGRDQYLVVKVDPQTGARVGGPYQVGGVYDGFTDYPFNDDGRQTYQDSQFRSWAVGNMAADPTNAAHLAVIWSDMRNGPATDPNPYNTTTNSDVIVSQSFNGGATWSAPTALAAAGDQFMPWGAYDTSGKLRIGYFDRSYDPANHKYGFTLASETSSGSLNFSFAQLTTALSDPTQNNFWFSNNGATTFLGDYSGIATYSGGVVALWTDLRETACIDIFCGSGQDAFYASHP